MLSCVQNRFRPTLDPAVADEVKAMQIDKAKQDLKERLFQHGASRYQAPEGEPLKVLDEDTYVHPT